MTAPSRPGSTTPTPTALADWSPPPATTGVPARRPVAAAASAVIAPVTSGPSKVGGSQAAGISSAASTSADQSRAARSNRMVPGAVGLVEGVVAGQPQAQVVLGQEDVGRPGPHLGLMVADPDELRRGEPGQRVVAGDLDQPLATDRRADRVAFGRGPLVVPQDRRAEDPVGLVEQHQPVHLAGQPDRDDVVTRRAGRGQATTRIATMAPSHQAAGSCSLHSGRGALNPYSAVPTPRTAPVSSTRTAFVAVVETSIPRTRPTVSGRRSRPRPDAAAQIDLVDDVLEQLLVARHGLGVDRRRTRPSPREMPASPRRRGSRARARRPSLRSVPRCIAAQSVPRSIISAATSSAWARVSMPPMWAWNRSVRSVLWRRSLASKLKPPGAMPPARRIS